MRKFVCSVPNQVTHGAGRVTKEVMADTEEEAVDKALKKFIKENASTARADILGTTSIICKPVKEDE